MSSIATTAAVVPIRPIADEASDDMPDDAIGDIEFGDDDEVVDPELIYGLSVINERVPNGRVLLANFDVRVWGIVVRDMILMVGRDDLIVISVPRATGRRRTDAPCVQFKDRELRRRITQKALTEYRQITDHDMAYDAHRRRAKAKAEGSIP